MVAYGSAYTVKSPDPLISDYRWILDRLPYAQGLQFVQIAYAKRNVRCKSALGRNASSLNSIIR